MKHQGIRNPEANALIAFALFAGGTTSIVYGAVTMNALGYETGATGLMIGIGGVVAVIGFFMTLNFLWAVRLTRGMRRGERVIARWLVPPEACEAFRAADLARTEQGMKNDYRLPRRIPHAGLEVIFSNDAVLIGNFFYGLSSSGIARFQGAKLLSGTPMLEFDTGMLRARVEPRVKIYDAIGVLRVPVSPMASDDARRVVRHFIDVIGRHVIVKPDFWPFRVRLGRRVAVVSAAIAGGGFLLNYLSIDLGTIPLFMALVGTILALAGLLLAVIASSMDKAKKGPA